jgi:prolyl oligopeptidase
MFRRAITADLARRREERWAAPSVPIDPKAYSHQVKDGTKYPAVLFVTGDGDTRVAPLHARKMTARLQAATSSGSERPILLLYDTKSGHSGGRPLNREIEVATDTLSFLFLELGVSGD